jgi:hypothetical protein
VSAKESPIYDREALRLIIAAMIFSNHQSTYSIKQAVDEAEALMKVNSLKEELPPPPPRRFYKGKKRFERS